MEQHGFTLWFTGMSGAGKSTLSAMTAEALRRRGLKVEVLDGDEVRENLSAGLTFSREDRETNIRRISFVAKLLSRNGVVAITAAISPYRSGREEARRQIADFVEVYVECPIEELQRRDVKGLYKKALAGEIENFTGITDPYEPPEAAEVRVNSKEQTPEESLRAILRYLENQGLIPSEES